MFFILFANLSDDQRSLVEKIYRDHKAVFLRSARRYASSDAGAEDVVSASFEKIIRHIDRIGRLKEKEQIAFCMTMVKNTAIDAIRKDRRNVYVEDMGLYRDPGEDYLESLIGQERQMALRRVYQALGDKDRKLLYLRFVQEMKIQEIADLLDLSYDTTAKRIQRLLAKLKNQMIKGGGR